MVDPKQVCLFIPGNLRKFKLNLFERVGKHIEQLGGSVIRGGDVGALERLSDDIIPIVGCMPELTGLIDKWKAAGRNRIQWDRGYARRVFATYLPKGENGGFYRWHLNSFQLRAVRECPPDRWNALKVPVAPWQRGGRQVVVLAPTPTYQKFHGIETWLEATLRELATLTDRQIVVRFKDSKRPLQADLAGAHCAIANGSIAGVEAVICGCPIIDNHESAAALVGLTDIKKIEHPVFPDRQPWLNALAYSQYSETELVDGTLWRLIT
jgi:hypothetical protein